MFTQVRKISHQRVYAIW